MLVPFFVQFQVRNSGAVFSPQTGTLSACFRFARIETDIIVFRLLYSPYQIGFFHFSSLDVMQLCNFFDVVQFHMTSNDGTFHTSIEKKRIAVYVFVQSIQIIFNKKRQASAACL